MVGLDTNVLVRYLAQDDPVQSPLAGSLLESLTADEPGFVGMITLVEALWVMEDVYGCPSDRLAEIVDGLLQTEHVVVESADLVWKALSRFRRGKADFADQLIACRAEAHGCRLTYTFDKAAARDAGMALLTRQALRAG